MAYAGAPRGLCERYGEASLERAFLKCIEAMPEDLRPSLLIVDDDPLITETLSYALGKDFEVMVSDSRHHAVSLLRQLDEAPQLALVDLGLPPMPHRPDEASS